MLSLIKKLAPQSALSIYRHCIVIFHKTISPFFAKVPFLSAWYFALFNHSYYKEQYALLNGNRAYQLRIKSKQSQSSPILRRNIHRLEKGLIMTPRKPIFALEYIEETQNSFALALSSSVHNQEELQWAQAVLTKYYQSVNVQNSELLIRLFTAFEVLLSKSSKGRNKPHFLTEMNNTPYPHSTLPPPEVSYEQFAAFIQLRRSTRWFKANPVCHEKIKKAVAVASQAPSACNRQPYEFFVIDEQPLLNKISQLAIGGAGFADKIPCLIVLVGDYSNYEHVRDRHVIYIDSSLAAMQFMQTLPTLGLASCPLNWPELNVQNDKIAKLLKLEKHQRTIMLIAVGEATEAGGIPFSQKKSPESLIKFFSSSHSKSDH